jgi:hypothetical protein
MLIRFKNKNTAAIISMIEKGKSHGGLPSCIELTVEEAQSIIEEVNSLRSTKDTQHQRYLFAFNNADARLAFLSKELSDEEKFKLLTEWTEGKLTVSFDTIPLKIVITESQGHLKGVHTND